MFTCRASQKEKTNILNAIKEKRQIIYNGRTIRDNKYLRSKSETISQWTHIFKELRERNTNLKSLCSKRMKAK